MRRTHQGILMNTHFGTYCITSMSLWVDAVSVRNSNSSDNLDSLGALMQETAPCCDSNEKKVNGRQSFRCLHQ